MESIRYKLTIAYRGTRYHGWQRQVTPPTWKNKPTDDGEGIPTVQDTLQKCLGQVLGHPATLVGSSRTDCGVHARGQVAHLDTTAVQIPPEGLRRAVNARLPGDILIRSIEPAPPGFDAIKSTVSKTYEYLVLNRPDRDVFGATLAFHRWQRMDVERMNDAAQRLVGTHDFASFARPGHGRETTVRTIHSFDVHRDGDLIRLRVRGSGFLWNQVRIMAGTLIEVGTGRFSADDVEGMLAAKDRRASGPTSPPHGLYLDQVFYE